MGGAHKRVTDARPEEGGGPGKWSSLRNAVIEIHAAKLRVTFRLFR